MNRKEEEEVNSLENFKLPGTFEVSTVWTVGGGAAGATAVCAGADWVGLDGCVETIPGLWETPPGLFTGINPLGVGVGATTWGILWPYALPVWGGIVPSEPGPGGPDW